MKTDQDYIKEGTELADGWYFRNTEYGDVFGCGDSVAGTWSFKSNYRQALAALAAQLTEQVDATDYRLDIGPKGTVLYEPQGGMFESPGLNSDRAMNTIKVIVDSKVLLE